MPIDRCAAAQAPLATARGMVKSALLPSPWIAGGCRKNTWPLRFPMKRILPRVAIEASKPSRAAKSLSLMKIIALRAPLPPKPSAAKTLWAVSVSSVSTNCSTSSTSARVRSAVEPSGSRP